MLELINVTRMFFMICCLDFVVKYGNCRIKLANVMAGWPTNVALDIKSVSKLDESEPGFDLTPDDMAKFHIWPSGIISYYIDDFSYDKILRDRIRTFLENINRITGLHFSEIPRPPAENETRWVMFINRQGLLHCADLKFSDFTNDGVQKVVLGYNCLSGDGHLAEVILSLVGVPPQHNAPLRNESITVNVANILPDKLHLFEELKDDEWLFHDIPYDFNSAGHYSLHKYTANGIATIKPRINVVDIEIGENTGLSYVDIWKIRMLYNFISKRKPSEVKKMQCNKLFVPGSNISSYQSDTEDEIQPRKKPNKYLLIPDETLDEGILNANKTKIGETVRNEHLNLKFTPKSKESGIHNLFDLSDDESSEIHTIKKKSHKNTTANHESLHHSGFRPIG